MSKLNEKSFEMEGYFLGDIYRHPYDSKKDYDINRYNVKDIIPNNLFLMSVNGTNKKNCSPILSKPPKQIYGEDSEKEFYDIRSKYEAREKYGEIIYVQKGISNRYLRFLDEELVNEIFYPTGGFLNEAVPQLLACESMLKLASRIIGKELSNPLLIENEKAVRQYIKLFQEKPETIKRLFEYSWNYQNTGVLDLTQDFCSHIEEKTYKLEQTLKK